MRFRAPKHLGERFLCSGNLYVVAERRTDFHVWERSGRDLGEIFRCRTLKMSRSEARFKSGRPKTIPRCLTGSHSFSAFRSRRRPRHGSAAFGPWQPMRSRRKMPPHSLKISVSRPTRWSTSRSRKGLYVPPGRYLERDGNERELCLSVIFACMYQTDTNYEQIVELIMTVIRCNGEA